MRNRYLREFNEFLRLHRVHDIYYQYLERSLLANHTMHVALKKSNIDPKDYTTHAFFLKYTPDQWLIQAFGWISDRPTRTAESWSNIHIQWQSIVYQIKIRQPK